MADGGERRHVLSLMAGPRIALSIRLRSFAGVDKLLHGQPVNLREVDSNELARSLIEEGLWGHPDLEFSVLIARGMTGDGEYSLRLRAMVG